MGKMDQPPSFEKPVQAYLTFDNPSHEGEYVFTMREEGHDQELRRIANSLEKELGEDWRVSFRGTRIEIFHKHTRGLRDDEKILRALTKTLPNKFQVDFEDGR